MAGYRIMIFAAFAAALLAFVAGTGTLCRARQATVGTDVAMGDVTDFDYTYSSSTYPPHYQRYRFYKEDGAYKFFHETREGDHFPLTEADATVSETTELSGDQWSDFLVLLVGGRAVARQEHLEDGDSGPWLYLYWTGDQGDIQEFSFVSYDTRLAFESLCESLRNP